MKWAFRLGTRVQTRIRENLDGICSEGDLCVCRAYGDLAASFVRSRERQAVC